jgi:glycosyltransferase involved in cell wall biosynthesis
VLSRVDEPFPLTSLEAMASGCAIIATRRGGIPEGVGGGGALVDADAPDEVAAILEDWVRDRRRLATMKLAATRRAQEFTWSSTAASLLQLLEQ